MKKLAVLSVVLLGSTLGLKAEALPILVGTDDGGGSWSADDGTRSATAQFSSWSHSDEPGVGGLRIVLSNVAEDVSVVPNEVLVGITFDYAGDIEDPTLDGMRNTSGVVNPTNIVSGNLDGENAFRDDLGSYEGFSEYTISSSAFDPLGINPVIDPSAAIHPLSTNGASFGIVNGTFSDGTTASLVPAIDYWVEDTLTILLVTSDGRFNFEDVSNVNFLYGTSYSVSVPEPGALSLLGAGLIAIGFVGRRRRKGPLSS